MEGGLNPQEIKLGGQLKNIRITARGEPKKNTPGSREAYGVAKVDAWVERGKGGGQGDENAKLPVLVGKSLNLDKVQPCCVPHHRKEKRKGQQNTDPEGEKRRGKYLKPRVVNCNRREKIGRKRGTRGGGRTRLKKLDWGQR